MPITDIGLLLRRTQKEAPKLPRWYSNTPASIVIGLGSARALCLTRKLNFLKKICSDNHSETVSSRTLASLSDDVDSICLVRECRDLEQYFHSNFTSAILQQEADICPLPREIKKVILSRDRGLRLEQHMSIVVEVKRQIGWPRLWDFALDHGPRCIDGLRNLVRVITFPPHALSACPLCEEENVPRDSLLSHVLNSHTRSLYSSNDILSLFSSITNSDSILFNYLYSLTNLF